MTQPSHPVSAIGERFAASASAGRPAFIPFVTVGYPSLEATAELLAGLAEGIADVIELGIPFSDPMADGPTIQRSSQHALERGTRIDDVLRVLGAFKGGPDPVPVVLFTYLNAPHARGVDAFVDEAAGAGADGILITDLPLGADPPLESRLEAGPLDLVRLVAPTTSPARAREISVRSQGFVYYISRTGVTGASAELAGGLDARVAALQGAASVPVAVGFGVSTPEQAASVGRVADGVVVGSALVERLGAEGVEGALSWARGIRTALEGCRG